MKKIYQNPKTDIVTISVAQMIATSNSGLLGTGDKPNDLDLNNAGETNEISGNLSRRSVWDDEDDDFEEGY